MNNHLGLIPIAAIHNTGGPWIVEEFSGFCSGGWCFQAVNSETGARGRVYHFTFDDDADKARARDLALADCAAFNRI